MIRTFLFHESLPAQIMRKNISEIVLKLNQDKNISKINDILCPMSQSKFKLKKTIDKLRFLRTISH